MLRRASFSAVRRLELIFLAAASCGLLTASAAAAGSVSPWHRVVLGRSVDGRAIVAFEGGDLAATRRGLVVGCIHGDESRERRSRRRFCRAARPLESIFGSFRT